PPHRRLQRRTVATRTCLRQNDFLISLPPLRQSPPNCPHLIPLPEGEETLHQDAEKMSVNFCKKNANSLLQRPYLPLEQGITRGCFPLRSGTGSCAAPLFYTKSGT